VLPRIDGVREERLYSAGFMSRERTADRSRAGALPAKEAVETFAISDR
jgi:hypothetical protein